MAKLKIKNLKNIQSSIRKSIIKAARLPEIRQGVANAIVGQIREESSAASQATESHELSFLVAQI